MNFKAQITYLVFLLRWECHVFHVNCSCVQVPVNILAKINCTGTSLIPASSPRCLGPSAPLRNGEAVQRALGSPSGTESSAASLLSRTVCLPDVCRVLLRRSTSFGAFGRFMVMWFTWPRGTLMMPGIRACHPYSWTTVLEEAQGRGVFGGGGRGCHTSTKSLPSTKPGWWSCRGLRFKCLQALAHLFIQTSHIPREKINGKRTKKQTGMCNCQTSAPHSGSWLPNRI